MTIIFGTMKDNKKYITAFIISVLVFISTCAVRTFHSTVECAWAQIVAYSVMTWYSLDWIGKDVKKQIWMIAFIVLGRVSLEILTRLFIIVDITTVFEIVIAIVTILLAWLCYRKQKLSVVILSIIVLTVLNSVVHHAWLDYLSNILM